MICQSLEICKMATRVRNVKNSFIGVQLTKELLEKLDAKVAETTLNRSQIIRLALIEYLAKE